MSLIKRAMADAFVDYLRCRLPPSLGVNVEAIQAEAASWEEPTKFPSVRILPQKFTLDPSQETELDDSSPDKLLLDVGDFIGTIEIRVSAKTRPSRLIVEDAVLNVMLEREFTPGIVVLQTKPVVVGGYVTAEAAVCTVELQDENWRDEQVLAKRRYTFMTLDAAYPALVVRTAYPINQLVMAFTEDLNSDSPATEDTIVNEDGTTSPTDL